MKTFSKSGPLTNAELDCLGDFLKGCKVGTAMNVEQLDGFFAALIAGPKAVMPNEYYPEVFGGEMSDACEFGSCDETNDILGLMMRHWDTIAATLNKDEVYVPLLLEDEKGVAHGNDWADGFMRGVAMRPDGWNELIEDKDHAGCVIPMLMLCHEHDENLQICPRPISTELRGKAIAYMALGLLDAYRYFSRHREANARVSTLELRRSASEGERNELCL